MNFSSLPLLRLSFLLPLIFTFHEIFAQDACMLYPVSIDQRANQSVLIIEGKVLSQEGFCDTNAHNIYTSNIVRIYKVFKGAIKDTTIEVITEGGIVGNEMEVLTSTLSLENGDNGIFFCENSNISSGKYQTSAFKVYSSLQGFIKYDLRNKTADEPFRHYKDIYNEVYGLLKQTTGKNYIKISENIDLNKLILSVNKTTAVPTITSFTPTTTTAGTGSILTIDGTNFGALQGTGFVEFKNSNNGGSGFMQPNASDYILWSDNQIQVKVPSRIAVSACAGTGVIRVNNSDPATVTSAAVLTIDYANSNTFSGGIAYLSDHVNDNASGGYTFQMETSFDANTPAKNAFSRALETWRCNTFINWNIGSTTAINIVAGDGVNVVRFDVGAELPVGTLGRCNSSYSSCAVGVWYVGEIDVTFDDGANWNFGPALPAPAQYDFESVALHELGHGHQLGHIIAVGAVMHYSLLNGATVRILNATNDIAGANFVMARSVVNNACGPTAMIALNAGTCALPVNYVYFNGNKNTDHTIILRWKTSEEINVNQFKIERSFDGINFVEIGSVNGSNSPIGADYEFTDENIKNINYYRLAQIDIDGSINYSTVIIVTDSYEEDKISIFSNPVIENLTFIFNNTNLINGNLRISNSTGQIIYEQNINSSSLNFQLNINLSHLSQGIYFYKLNTSTKIYSGKFVKE